MVSKEEVKKIYYLANLNVKEEELDIIAKKFDDVLVFANEINITVLWEKMLLKKVFQGKMHFWMQVTKSMDILDCKGLWNNGYFKYKRRFYQW